MLPKAREIEIHRFIDDCCLCGNGLIKLIVFTRSFHTGIRVEDPKTMRSWSKGIAFANRGESMCNIFCMV